MYSRGHGEPADGVGEGPDHGVDRGVARERTPRGRG